MIDRRRLVLAGAATVPLSACKVANVGKHVVQSAEQPWSYARTGNQERFEVRHGDHWKSEHSHSERSEMAVFDFMKRGVDIWQSFSLFIESSLPSHAKWRIFGQWHAYKDPWDDYNFPPFAQVLVGDSFQIQTVSDPHLRQSAHRHTPQIVRYEAPNFEFGRWHNFVYKIRFDPFGHGGLHAWINGNQVAAFDNIPIGFNDLVGPYFKYGVYRPPADPFPLAARYANMEQGYASLAARIANPLPI